MSKLHWVALISSARIGGTLATRLLKYFGSLEAVFTADAVDLMQVQGIGQNTANAIMRADLTSVQDMLERLTRAGIEAVTWEEPIYPQNLLCIPDAPPVLFVRGELRREDARAIAIVGTRQPVQEALMLAEHLAFELAQRGWIIVSGMAIGIDTAAHSGALKAAGRTLAVLGSGIQNIYPRRNRSLAELIVGSGALLSEVLPDAPVSRQGLIARNRITSGLSRAVFVIQSTEDSGSINTARRARKQGRTLYALDDGTPSHDQLLAINATALQAGQIDWDNLSNELDRREVKPVENHTDGSQPRLL
ncbi:MAG: DNA-processing protein DprA [Anaerolineae bacterium]|nr:DNA-processing protein DprA [Anaerolineae bacterium]